jgi:UrcA family protein
MIGENVMKSLNAALAAACLFAAPTTAIAATSQGGDGVEIVAPAPTQRVSTAGLDLRDPQNLERFRTRVTRAIETACNPGNRINADLSPDWQCRREMGASATATLYSLARRGAGQTLASN